MTSKSARVLAFITAALGAAATFVQFYHSLMYKLSDGYTVLYGINHFFSFFTCQVNTLVFICLFSFAIFPNSRFTRWFAKPVSNGGVLLYILIVGVIFYLLLYSTITSAGWNLVATHVLHGAVPAAYFFLWFFYFRGGALQYVHCFRWLIIPGLYFVYVLGRGELLLVYPYFFLDAARYGYGRVAINAGAIFFFFLIMGATLVFLDNRLKLRKLNK